MSRSVSTINVNLETKVKITEWNDYITTYLKYSNNEYRPQGIHSGYDFCAAQAGFVSSPLNSLITKMIGNYTNWNRKCPFPPGQYYVKDLNLHASHLPAIIPAGQYIVNVTSSIQSNIWLYNLSMYATVYNYGIQDLNIGWNFWRLCRRIEVCRFLFLFFFFSEMINFTHLCTYSFY